MKVRRKPYEPASGRCPRPGCPRSDARFDDVKMRTIQVDCQRCGRFLIDQAELDDFLQVSR